MKRLYKFSLIILFSSLISFCSSSQQSAGNENMSKVTFDLYKFDSNGLMKNSETGESESIDFEFCIPALGRCIEEVKAIDESIRIYAQTPERIVCRNNFILCGANSQKKNFREIIISLANLKYIEKIAEVNLNE